MHKLEFLESFGVNHPELDAEHRRIVDLINAVADEVPTGNFERFIERVDELKDYLIAHFKHEEDIIEELGFREFDEHKQHHKELLEKFLKDIEQAKARGTLEGIDTFVDTLPNLLIHDILRADIEFKSFMIETIGLLDDRETEKNYDQKPQYSTKKPK